MMDMTWDILLAVVFLGLGIAFRRGMLAEWVLGRDPEARSKYNEPVALRFFSNLMFVMCACNLVSVAGGLLANRTVTMVGIGLNLVTLAAGVLYFSKNAKFRK